MIQTAIADKNIRSKNLESKYLPLPPLAVLESPQRSRCANCRLEANSLLVSFDSSLRIGDCFNLAISPPEIKTELINPSPHTHLTTLQKQQCHPDPRSGRKTMSAEPFYPLIPNSKFRVWTAEEHDPPGVSLGLSILTYPQNAASSNRIFLELHFLRLLEYGLRAMSLQCLIDCIKSQR